MLAIFFGALSGFAVATLLPFFLFSPKKLVQIGPFTFLSSFRKAWPRFVESIPQLVHTEGLEEELVEIVASADLRKEAAPLIDDRMESFFGEVTKQVPMAAMFLQGSLADTLKSQAREQLLGLLPDLQRRAGERIAGDLDLGAILQKQLEDVEQVEGWLEAALRPKLNTIRLFGTAVGGVIGILHALVCFFLLH